MLRSFGIPGTVHQTSAAPGPPLARVSPLSRRATARPTRRAAESGFLFRPGTSRPSREWSRISSPSRNDLLGCLIFGAARPVSGSIAGACAGRPDGGGIGCPRDSDMQEGRARHSRDATAAPHHLRRGDLMFWKGHVAIRSPRHFGCVHANAFHMAVMIEPVAEAVAAFAPRGSRCAASSALRFDRVPAFFHAAVAGLRPYVRSKLIVGRCNVEPRCGFADGTRSRNLIEVR